MNGWLEPLPLLVSCPAQARGAQCSSFGRPTAMPTCRAEGTASPLRCDVALRDHMELGVLMNVAIAVPVAPARALARRRGPRYQSRAHKHVQMKFVAM